MRLDKILSITFFKFFRDYIRPKLPPRRGRIPILMYHSISDLDDRTNAGYYKTNTNPKIFIQHMRILSQSGYRVISLDEAVTLISQKIPYPEMTISKSYPWPDKTLRHLFKNKDSIKKQSYLLLHEKKETVELSFSEKPIKREIKSLNTKATNYKSLTPVVLTFDDGFRDFYETAWPILKNHGFTASVFLPTGFIANSRKKMNGRECLTWREVRELSAAGVDFGGHTVSHVQIHRLDRLTAEKEIKDTKIAIEQFLGIPVRHYSYAYAFPEHDRAFVAFLRKVLIDAKYKAGVTTRIGTALPGDDLFTIKRLPVNSDDDETLFRAKLDGAYDWLGWPQRISKRIRRRAGF